MFMLCVCSRGNRASRVLRTPVAACDPETKTIYITDTKHSRTTSKHINKWISLVEEEEGDCSQVTLEKEIFLSLNKQINLGKIFKNR